ncbi:MAG: hypothetical protein K6F92_05315 [Lachnospiraceae bacterium]|nr:hypothetical protein [Lachnospiraceae bacterium]
MATKTLRNIRTAFLAACVGATALFSGCGGSVPLVNVNEADYILNDTYYASCKLSGTYGEDYNLVAQNSQYKLYMREADLAVVVENVETGAVMQSAISYDDGKSNKTWFGAMQSALVLTYINGSNDNKQADLVNDAVTKKIQYSDNGFKADVYWTKYQFGMTLEVALEENGLVAHVSDESIVEDNEKYMIGTISIYPYMGNSYLDTNEGYLFIPDGNGALIYLDNKEGRFATGFSSMIYGTDIGFKDSQVVSLLWDRYDMVTENEKVLAPVFGIAHTDDEIAYLAVVEDGAMRATIEAHPNGVSVDYNRAYAKFIERKLYTQPTSNNSTSGSLHLTESDRSHSDLRVRYLFLSGDEANYAGMAGAYRDYLIENGELVVGDTSYNTRVDFLGTDRESWLVGTTGVTMTTVDDVKEICTDLNSSGVSNIFSIYKGWQDGGIYNLPITSFDVEGDIGSKSSVKKLMEFMASAGNELYLYDDALTLNPDEATASFNVINQVNKRRYKISTYKDVYDEFMYLAPAKTYANLTKLISQMKKKSVTGLCVAGISNNIFAYNFGGNTYNRYDCAGTYEATLDKAYADMSLVLEQPFAYLWHDTKAFVDMPLYTSSYIVEDASVPFLSMVLHGVIPVYSEYVNFEANKQEFFLKMVETGTFPSFYITKASSSDLIYTNSSDIYSSQYDIYRDEIISYAQELGAICEKTEGSYIVSHDMNDNGVTVVGYDNGTKVYVNYSDSAKTVDGVTVEAMSYMVK